MKKIALISSLFLFVATVVVQAASVHVGMENKYSIGNKDVPAKVYVLFLEAKASSEKVSLWNSSKYYESSFMKTDHGWWSNKDACIERTNKMPIPDSSFYDSHYSYSLISGHEDDIIDALSSQEVQKEFNEWYADWLRNPTWSEVCEYINDKLKGHFDAEYEKRASEIAQRYSEALQWNIESHIFSFGYYAHKTNAPSPSSGNVFQFIDIIVDIIYNGAINVGLPPNELHCTFDFSEAQIFEGYDNSIVYINFSAIQNDDSFRDALPVMATLATSNSRGAVANDIGWQRDTYGTGDRLFLRQVKEIRDSASNSSDASPSPISNL